MTPLRALPARTLYHHCTAKKLSFTTTAEPKPTEDMAGRPAASPEGGSQHARGFAIGGHQAVGLQPEHVLEAGG